MKIPFPWLPFLKFDFTGVPVVLALLLYGLDSGVTASIVACLAILARSGDLVGALMKVLGEVSTIAGLYAGLSLLRSCRVLCSTAMGLLSRIAVMSVFNLIVLPLYYGMPFQVAIGLLPMLGVFNAMQGALTVGLGFFLYKAYRSRIPGEEAFTV
ncbi:MAG: hypothetical protein ACLFVP_07550 [Candidatus Bathyarchaeia archaeon]